MSIVKEGGVLVVLHYSRKEVWRWSIVEASLTLSGRESSGALRAWTELTQRSVIGGKSSRSSEWSDVAATRIR